VIAQLEEDLVHLEGRQDRLDQDRGADAAARHAEGSWAWTNTSFQRRASSRLSSLGR
jgi:hypothetical protein